MKLKTLTFNILASISILLSIKNYQTYSNQLIINISIILTSMLIINISTISKKALTKKNLLKLNLIILTTITALSTYQRYLNYQEQTLQITLIIQTCLYLTLTIINLLLLKNLRQLILNLFKNN